MIAVVICAGGASKRFGAKKEYQKINGGTTVLGAAVQVFFKIDNIDTIAVAIPKNNEEEARKSIPAEFLSSEKPKLIFCEGGDTRQASVYNALLTLNQYNPKIVLIHDGARPFASAGLIQSVIDAVLKYDAAIPVLPFSDTPKEHNGKFITRHLRRAETGAAQTPQGFKFAEILQAHVAAHTAAQQAAHTSAHAVYEEFTDDAEVWGKYAGNVAVVPGEPENRKITYKEDLV